MAKAIFNTKFASDIKKNGQIVKVLDYVGNDMYLIEFRNGKQLEVYGNELIFLGDESLYD